MRGVELDEYKFICVRSVRVKQIPYSNFACIEYITLYLIQYVAKIFAFAQGKNISLKLN